MCVHAVGRLQEDHETNPDQWERLKYRRLLDTALASVAHFIGAQQDDVIFAENTIRGKHFNCAVVLASAKHKHCQHIMIDDLADLLCTV